VPHRPGTLKALAFRSGQVVASDEVRRAGVPARIVLVPDRSLTAPDGEDFSFVTVRIEEREGNLCPEADNVVRFTLEGPGRIAGVDNGNPAPWTSTPRCSVYLNRRVGDAGVRNVRTWPRGEDH
jgi:beta-galactosidase